MKAITLMYHDVVEYGAPDASGFPGVDAALYKLDRQRFADHLRAIADALPTQPLRVADPPVACGIPVYLTFDDGGVSAHTRTADMLEEYGWRGHFFVTAGSTGAPGFLCPDQIRDLSARGHVVGSHSWSHPLRMARCDRSTLVREWSRSTDFLSDLLGERVITASVPGGHYARSVAEAAAEAGLETLFTSEPTMESRQVGTCRVFGRYTIQRWTSPEVAAAIATGRFAPRARQLILWNAKKLMKMIGGDRYLEVRRSLLDDRRIDDRSPKVIKPTTHPPVRRKS